MTNTIAWIMFFFLLGFVVSLILGLRKLFQISRKKTHRDEGLIPDEEEE